MRGRVSKIEIYAKFLHTRPGPSCSSLSRLISPRAYLWYTPWSVEPTEPPWWTVPVHRIGRVTLTGCGGRSRPPSHTPHTNRTNEAGGRGA